MSEVLLARLGIIIVAIITLTSIIATPTISTSNETRARTRL